MEKLIYVDDSLPGITRKGAGTGFAYYDVDGKLIRDAEERARLNAVALPPAYTDEWYCPAPNGHILATGYDDRGRKQYRYHPEFRRMREGDKFDRCAAFGRKLPLIRARVDDDLSQPKMTETTALACVVRLLDLSAIRVGNEQYAEANESFGATTLRNRHADISARTIHLSFNGKGGREREVKLTDGRLANAVRRMKDLPGKGAGQHLFRYRDDDGDVQPVTSHAVNAYIREAMGDDFSAKHFRTWHASVFAFEALVEADKELTITSILDEVSSRLGNTPATARKSYIHPAVIERVSGQAEWRDSLRLPRSTKWLTRTERGLLDLLEEGPPAEQLLAA
ncbi:DNA topoisomerase IB [Erythrobacter rubeus]|uniref:DNA topoisomerase n=1 Tax=Erythrobacter rubeus TaxID=2760803 RepID=A0ABR8KTB2_9SPHN|nr:DNA topoisomerase IB [Erythrobacter rubeus]MBD2841381.1 DNA topoisomerase IB [Erythrobacter rubeus]